MDKKKTLASSTSTKRRKLRENKTIMLPDPLEELPELPEFKESELMEVEQKPKSKGIKRFFKFGKKEAKKELKKEVKAETIEEPITPFKEEEIYILEDTGSGHTKKIEPELALWLNDGRVVKSVEELTKAFKTMKSRVFQQHKEKNDIVEWIRDIIGDVQLASELAIAKSKRDTLKILDNHKKHEKRKEKKSVKQETKIKKAIPKIHEEKHENLQNEKSMEIQQAIKKITHKQIIKKPETLEEREEQIAEKEQLLELEEEHINKKRIELTNKRYKLIKEKGTIEKEKFEKLLEQHGKIEETVTYNEGAYNEEAGMPELELDTEYTKEKIEGLIEQTRKAIEQNQKEEAKHLVEEIKTGLEVIGTSTKENKKLEYEVLELESDLKLSMLA
ncbi:hypothetical protein CMO88_01295 [Candidatus Woesearchaeota archaeon]|nr:hypothetical protein [Candidatus Woesearchaeota archaeon]|tara:strand:- start:11725 stop:12891 length:1167 start_codon:yes stop_codon:yes gene_type:complete